jgi:hypothetical protein
VGCPRGPCCLDSVAVLYSLLRRANKLLSLALGALDSRASATKAIVVVNLTTENDKVVLEVQGWDKLWALKSRLEIPRANIRSVRADPTIARGWWKGIRAPGTHLPGVIIAGTFYQQGKRIFWDVRDPENTIVIELMDHRYDQLIVEVADPPAVVRKIQDALPQRA